MTTTITLANITSGAVDGNGVFDVLLRALKAHIHQEYTAGRINGPDYATVYLGAVQGTLEQAMSLSLSMEKVNRELALMDIQIANATKQGLVLDKQAAQLDAEIAYLNEQRLTEVKRNQTNGLLDQEIARTEAQIDQIEQQTANIVAEGVNIPKQGILLEKQAEQADQQTANLLAQAANIPKEGLVLDGQKCKLDAEYDVLLAQKDKTTAETAVLNQKKLTEQAQVSSDNVDPDSIVGRQAALYAAQTDGFLRDAEQKAAKLLIDTWNVRRTTDSGTIAGAPPGGVDNGLGDANIARAVNKLLTSIGA